MNFKEAYQTLEIPDGASKDEAKKAFKKLAAKYHPDVNKEPDAEAKFKKVNEAWQIIDSGKPTTREAPPPNYGNWGNIDDFMNSVVGHATKRKHFFARDVELHETISFKESVLGCTKEIKYKRNARCETCRGSGEKILNNGCGTCGGTGELKSFAGFSVFIQVCPTCRGKVVSEPCTDCSSQGFSNVETMVTVNIPPKVKEGNVLNIGNRGNYIGDVMMGMDNHTRVLIHMHVTPQDNLSLRENDVICSISIDLLEALQGCVKEVPTIDGSKEVIIPESTKNKDEVIIPNLGIGRRGNQIVIVNVNYPSDTAGLIDFLKKE